MAAVLWRLGRGPLRLPRVTDRYYVDRRVARIRVGDAGRAFKNRVRIGVRVLRVDSFRLAAQTRCAMRLGSFSVASCLSRSAGPALAQTPAASARIDTTSLRLTMPDPYQVTAVLEPIRRVTIIAPADGLIRTLDARLGLPVRESQELAQFDRGESNARLLIAQAELKEKQASRNNTGAAQAQVEAAEARGRARQDGARSLHDPCAVRGPGPESQRVRRPVRPERDADPGIG